MSPGRIVFLASLALVLLLTAPGSNACAQGLDLTGPERFVLGQTESVIFSARFDQTARSGQTGHPDQAAASDRSVRFYTNVGTIESLADEGGRARARYLPPADQRPSVAIVVAVAGDFATVDWKVLRLIGRPTVRFTFEANSRVMVRVGESNYGPVQTDRRGQGEIQLEVPPGVRRALATGTDRMGNSIEQEIDLAPPPFDQVFALCGSRSVEVFAVDASGGPRQQPPALVGPGSVLGELRSPSPGRFVAALRFEQALSAATVQAGLTSSDLAVECELPMADPERVTLTLGERTSTHAGDLVAVEARLVYPEGVLRREVELALSADAGEINEVVPSEDGVQRARWIVPEGMAAEVRASVVGTNLSVRATLSSAAQVTRYRRFALDAQIGVAANFGRVLGPLALVHGWGRIPVGNHTLLVGAGVGYVGAWDTSADRDGLEQVELRLSALPVLGEVGYAIPLGRFEVSARLVGGALVAFTSMTSSSAGHTRSVDLTWALGGAVGGDIALGPGRLGLNVGYLHAPLTGRVDGNAVGLTAALSYQVRL